MKNKLDYNVLANLIYLNAIVPISIVNDKFETLYCYPNTEHHILDSSIAKEVVRLAKKKHSLEEMPCIVSGEFNYLCGVIELTNDEFIIIGPVASQRQTPAVFAKIFTETTPKASIDKLYSISCSCSIADSTRFASILSTANILFKQQYIEPIDILRSSNHQIESNTEFVFNEETNPRLQSDAVLLVEKMVQTAIKSGNKNALDYVWSKPYTYSNYLNNSTERHYKDATIIYYTMIAQAAVDGGAPREVVIRILREKIYYLEHTNELSKLLADSIDVSYQLCALVQKYKGIDPEDDIRDVCEKYINDHLGEKITVDLLAHISGTSRKKIYTTFDINYGKTVNDYIQEQRIERSKVLLTSSNYTLGEIASKLGYASQGYFTKVFSEQVGCTPKQYRVAKANASSPDYESILETELFNESE